MAIAFAMASFGCATDPLAPAARTIELNDLIRPVEATTDVAVPDQPTAADEARDARADRQADAVSRAIDALRERDEAAAARAAEAEAARDEASGPDIVEPLSDEEREFLAREITTGERWPVESLVGQINGRPIYADEILLPIEDRLRADVDGLARPEALQLIEETVSRRFFQDVVNLLVLTEAESELSDEERQGLFAWLGQLRGSAIAERGGTLAQAEQELREELGQDLDEFIEGERTRALIQRLISQRIGPRVRVSWTDVKRAYEDNIDVFAPPGEALIGRISLRLPADGDESARAIEQRERLAQAERAFARGETFEQVAARLNVRDNGRWRSFAYATDGSGMLEGFLESAAEAMRGREVGEVVGPIDIVPPNATRATSRVWFTIIEEDRPEPRSLYEPDVQLQLRDQLLGQRERIEQDRYLASLQSPTLRREMERMRTRLVLIALRRYLPNA